MLGLGLGMSPSSSSSSENVGLGVGVTSTDEEKGKEACRRILEGDLGFKWVRQGRVAEFIGGL